MLQNAVLDRPYRGVALREGLENPMGCGVWGTGEEAGWPAVEQPSREAGRGEAGRTKSDVFGVLSACWTAETSLDCGVLIEKKRKKGEFERRICCFFRAVLHS